MHLHVHQIPITFPWYYINHKGWIQNNPSMLCAQEHTVNSEKPFKHRLNQQTQSIQNNNRMLVIINCDGEQCNVKQYWKSRDLMASSNSCRTPGTRQTNIPRTTRSGFTRSTHWCSYRILPVQKSTSKMSMSVLDARPKCLYLKNCRYKEHCMWSTNTTWAFGRAACMLWKRLNWAIHPPVIVRLSIKSNSALISTVEVHKKKSIIGKSNDLYRSYLERVPNPIECIIRLNHDRSLRPPVGASVIEVVMCPSGHWVGFRAYTHFWKHDELKCLFDFFISSRMLTSWNSECPRGIG